jgi:SPP1 family predicted phage head-tail adaptor
MRAGTLRERVTIQASTPVQDGYGEPIDAWANLATNPTVWASVMPRASGERFIGGAEQLQATISHTVRIRYRTDVTVKMRLVWRTTRILLIQNVVDPDGRKADMILMCEEVQT